MSMGKVKLRRKLAPFLPYVDRAVNKSSEASKANASKTPDDSWIDLSIIDTWLQVCDQNHGGHCLTSRDARNSQLGGPVWLIDIKRLCLVRAEAKMNYFALSYVWGNSISARTTRANLNEFCKENIFRQEDLLLPQTIVDVIALIQLLHGTYLWVDRLCIVQDDGPEKLIQLNNMAAIYAGAYATIVVADGDASSGLRGICDVSDPRTYSARPRYLEEPKLDIESIPQRSEFSVVHFANTLENDLSTPSSIASDTGDDSETFLNRPAGKSSNGLEHLDSQEERGPRTPIPTRIKKKKLFKATRIFSRSSPFCFWKVTGTPELGHFKNIYSPSARSSFKARL